MVMPLAVLMVEDLEIDAQLIVRALEKAGYEIIFKRVQTAGQMRAALKKRTWDVVISECNLLKFDGRAALELLIKVRPDIPFIIVSDGVNEASALAMMKAGARDYLIKSNLTRLAPVVARELEQAQDRRERSQALQALRESEELFRLAFENANIGMCLMDTEGRYIKVNRQFCEMCGYSPAEIEGMSVNDLTHPDYHNVSPTFIKRANSGELDYVEFEKLYIHKQGRLVWGRVSSSLVRNAAGAPVYFISHVQDITERKQGEDALRKSEERFRNLVQDMQVGVLLQNPQAEIILSNPKALELLGVSEDQLLGKTSFDRDWNVIHEDGTPFPGETHPVPQAIAARQSVLNVVMGVYRPTSGDRIWLSVDAEPQLNDDGTVRQVVCSFTDITERKRAEAALKESEAINQAILKNSPIGISVRSRTGQLLSANEAWKKIWAISESDLQKDAALDRQSLSFNERDGYLKLHQDDVRRIYEQGGYLYIPELKTSHPRPGAAEWVSQHFYAIQDANRQVVRVVILTEDITERKQIEKQLRQLSRAVEQNPSSIVITDMDGKIEYVNPKFTELTGYTLEEVRMQNPRILQSGQTSAEVYRDLWQTILSGEEWRGEFLNRKKNGELYWEFASISALTDAKDNVTHFVAVKEDVTSRKEDEENIRRLNAALEKLAMTDFLTNLYNRRYFMQRGEEEFKRARRGGQPLSLLMMDINDFKMVNDTHGHEAGDAALKQVAAVLKSNLREIDILGRMGGDEFAVLLPNTHLQDAILSAERIRRALANQTVQAPGASLNITVSIGTAVCTHEMESMDDMLRNADAAMYREKRSGN